MKSIRGFTIVEVAVVIAIVSILATLITLGFNRSQAEARNDSAKAKISVIAAALEKYYSVNGEYPTCAAIASPVAVTTVEATILKGIDPNTLTRKGAANGTNSIICAAANKTNFSYTSATTTFTLSYQEELTNAVITVTN